MLHKLMTSSVAVSGDTYVFELHYMVVVECLQDFCLLSQQVHIVFVQELLFDNLYINDFWNVSIQP